MVALRWRRLNLNRATQLVNAPAAWTALGGVQNAGAGIKIAIIDTGIDQTHPAFQDSSLAMPAGYPICSGSDCAFTSNKVIVARSYVRLVAAGSDPQNPAADSRPDDYSPRDRIGHGTAVASCAAGMPTLSPAGLTLTGVAPKAYLGNYKVFGSPEVNEIDPRRSDYHGARRRAERSHGYCFTFARLTRANRPPRFGRSLRERYGSSMRRTGHGR